MDDTDREQIKLALDILKKRWSLKNHLEVIRHLIEKVDKTVLQLAERKARMKDKPEEGE